MKFCQHTAACVLTYTMFKKSTSAYQGQMSCGLPGVLKISITASILPTTRLLFGIEQDALSLVVHSFVTSNTLLLSSNTFKKEHILANHLPSW